MNTLFDASIIPQEVHDIVGSEFAIRPLAIDDYSKGHLQLLSVLTETPDRGQQAYEDQFKLLQSIANTYYIVALTSKDDPSKVIGSGSVIVERKFIRGHASLAHIEDIVVSKDIQGKGLGKKLLQSLILLSKRLGCYKTLLDCSDENRGFYEKCGFTRKGNEMVIYTQ